MNPAATPLRFADLAWGEDGLPRSVRFGDVYFSREGGLDESRHVFLDGNQLSERFAALGPHDDFVVAETGFGTGLNFLACLQTWQAHAPASAHLHYLSVEKYPLRPDDLRRALALWPELAETADRLLEHYPACLYPGFHRLVLQEPVSLTLMIGDALDGLDQWLPSRHPAHAHPTRRVDAWFLDGFAPARNADLWTGELLDLVRNLSTTGTTVASFTAASAVRRGLTERGFSVRKTPGFGRKREMIQAMLASTDPPPSPASFTDSPYRGEHPQAWSVSRGSLPAGAPVAIVGAGLAGAHAAHALARRGVEVTVFDARGKAGAGASGNAQGILYGKLSAHGGPLGEFNLAALSFAVRHYAPWLKDASLGQACGVLQLATGDKSRQEQADLLERWSEQTLFKAVDAAVASERAGLPLGRGGLHFPGLGWVCPPRLCERLLEAAQLSVQAATVTGLAREGALWQLAGDDGTPLGHFSAVVLACGEAVSRFPQASTLPLKPLRGQISQLPTSKAHQPPHIPLCADGYVAPPGADGFCFGASYRPGADDLAVSETEHEENLDRLRTQFPGILGEEVVAGDCSGRAGYRCTTPDRLPLAGPAPDVTAFTERFALLRKNAHAAIASPGAWHDGLYVSTGYGSRGLAYVPLATAWLVSQMLGEPPVLGRDLGAALNPARFLVRDLIRGKA